MEATQERKGSKNVAIAKFILCSMLGIFMFFVSIPYNGKNSIPLDHLTTIIRGLLGDYQKYVVLLIMICGAALPFLKKTWNKSGLNIFFTVFKILGVICGVMYIWNLGPRFLHENKDLFPFLFNSLCCSLAFLIPLGALFLSFLTNYGLMEFIGVFMQPLMRLIWRTPGRSAIDAVASFVGSYSLALLITDKVYQDGKYTKKEATIIATGFSTVSATFMVVVAKTLDIMDMWNFYFWTSLVVTFIVTAITARIFPLSKIADDYYEGATPDPEEIVKKDRLKTAWSEALKVAESSGSITQNVWASAKDGGRMISTILPTIMSIGLTGMLIALYTPVFKVIGYLFIPFTTLVQLPEAVVAGQAVATSIAEMFLPAAFVVGASIQTRYVVAVTCISEILFFSASIPCILSTKIPINIPKILILWVERVIFTILLSGVIAMIAF